MALFSERMGLKPVRDILQINSMDDDLRNSLWNACDLLILARMREVQTYLPADKPAWDFLRALWFELLKWPLDTIQSFTPGSYTDLRKHFFEAPYPFVYDFIEFCANCQVLRASERDGFRKLCNQILQRELSGYRFIGDTLAPITSDQEVEAIQKGLKLDAKFRTVAVHLQSALSLLADRQSPDYRNSIKESISAVEAMCQILTGDPKATLGQAIKKLQDSGISLHPAFRDALSKLYGYTNDAEGIRHALLEESKLDADDARFMLVTCSAFANYLAAKSAN